MKAKKYYKKIAASLKISKKIKLVVTDIFDFRSKQILLKQWFKPMRVEIMSLSLMIKKLPIIAGLIILNHFMIKN